MSADEKEWFAQLPPRLTVLPHWIWGIVGALVLAMVLWSSRVLAADFTLSDGQGNTVTLTDEPCVTTVGFFEDMPSNMRVHFKAASTHWNGKDYIACWLLKADGTHFIVDETGDHGVLEGTEFMRKNVDA